MLILLMFLLVRPQRVDLSWQKSNVKGEGMNTLKCLKKTAGLSQYDLAFSAGISAPRISLGEHGFVCFHQREKQKLAALLNVPVDRITWLSSPVPKRPKRSTHLDAQGPTPDEPGQEQAT
jgi:hypothetical protein